MVRNYGVVFLFYLMVVTAIHGEWGTNTKKEGAPFRNEWTCARIRHSIIFNGFRCESIYIRCVYVIWARKRQLNHYKMSQYAWKYWSGKESIRYIAYMAHMCTAHTHTQTLTESLTCIERTTPPRHQIQMNTKNERMGIKVRTKWYRTNAIRTKKKAKEKQNRQE